MTDANSAIANFVKPFERLRIGAIDYDVLFYIDPPEDYKSDDDSFYGYADHVKRNIGIQIAQHPQDMARVAMFWAIDALLDVYDLNMVEHITEKADEAELECVDDDVMHTMGQFTMAWLAFWRDNVDFAFWVLSTGGAIEFKIEDGQAA